MRAIVSVATGSYIKGVDRLTEWCAANSEDYATWRGQLPTGSPEHKDVPYAFKSYALKYAAEHGATTMLWADACIIPVKPLDELWERIERDGYWVANNGFSNFEWTADSAYQDLFVPDIGNGLYDNATIDDLRNINRKIQHVVATSFGICLGHPTGRAILDEYFRLASTTRAFCGPWINSSYGVPACPAADAGFHDTRRHPCGPVDVRGHRHDQTALSVIAWRLGCQLTNSPDVFAYGKLGDPVDETVILLADGSY